MRQILIVSLIFMLAGAALAQTPVLVKDINPGTGNSSPISIETPVLIDSVIYFSASDGAHGQELWRSDGTATGTFMLKDIRPDSLGSAPIRFTVIGGKIFFFANDGVHGDELWVTDGTEAGTVLVKDINPGLGNAIRRNYLPQERDRMVYKGMLYFAADTGPDYAQLWRSDGTEAGTQFVKDVCPDCDANNFSTGEFAVLNDTLYLIAQFDFWRSDGTGAGTFVFLDNGDPAAPGSIRYLASVNGLLYMTGGKSVFSLDLWSSDGTKAGTRLVKDFADSGTPHFFTSFADRVFFFSDDNLWSTDGTEAGTQMESQLLAENPFQRRNNMLVWKNELYYRARAANNTFYLYKTNGSPNAETQVYVQNFLSTAMSTPVYFATNEDYFFYDAYSNNPSVTGFVRVDSAGAIKAFSLNSTAEHLVIAADNLFFWTRTNTTGTELWKLPLKPSSALNPESNTLMVSIYPSLSADGQFYLSGTAQVQGELNLQVFNPLGHLVYQGVQAPEQSIQLNDLPNGPYWIRLSDETGKHALQKVMIMR